MSINDIAELINQIPNLIQYLYPGYITIFVFQFLLGKKMQTDSMLFIKIISISFIYKVFLDSTILKITTQASVTSILYNVCLIVLSLIIPYIIHILRNLKFINGLLEKIGIDVSVSQNEIEHIIKKDNNPWFRIYMGNKNFMYEGFIDSFEIEENKYICLRKYRKYYLDEKNQYEATLQYDGTAGEEKIIVYFRDIEHIETIKLKN